MSRLGPNDAHLHYADGSHRWTDPLGEMDDEAWREVVEAHKQAHRENLAHENARWPGKLRNRSAADPHA